MQTEFSLVCEILARASTERFERARNTATRSEAKGNALFFTSFYDISFQLIISCSSFYFLWLFASFKRLSKPVIPVFPHFVHRWHCIPIAISI